MNIEQFAAIYVNYIEPALKVFVMFLLVMLVLSFWAKVKEGKILDLSAVIFENTINGVYKTVYYIGLGIWMFFAYIGRIFRVVFATIRDFFISRI